MSDETFEDFDDTVDDEDVATPAAPATPSEEENLTAFAEEVVEGVDPSQYITFTTTGGQARYVPATEPMRLAEAFATTGLVVGGAFKFFLNGTEVNWDTIIPNGSTVSILGQAVKGGVA